MDRDFHSSRSAAEPKPAKARAAATAALKTEVRMLGGRDQANGRDLGFNFAPATMQRMAQYL
jgi:hypothetical protein